MLNLSTIQLPIKIQQFPVLSIYRKHSKSDYKKRRKEIDTLNDKMKIMAFQAPTNETHHSLVIPQRTKETPKHQQNPNDKKHQFTWRVLGLETSMEKSNRSIIRFRFLEIEFTNLKQTNREFPGFVIMPKLTKNTLNWFNSIRNRIWYSDFIVFCLFVVGLFTLFICPNSEPNSPPKSLSSLN